MARLLAVALALACLVPAGVLAVPAGPATPGLTDATGAEAAAPTPAATAASDSAASVPVYTESNTSNYLGPSADAITVSTVTSTDLDVGAAVATDATRLAVRFQVGNIVPAYQSAPPDERPTVVRTYFERIENATAILSARERAALSALATGEIDTNTYLRRIARIDAAATRLATTLEQLEAFAQSEGYPVPATSGAIGRLEVRLATLQGPVRERIGAAMTGDRPPLRVRVDATSSALVLGTVPDTAASTPRHLREAYVPANYAPDGTGRFPDLTAAFDAVLAQYPWVDQASSGGSVFQFGTSETYRVDIPHAHGRLSVLIEGATRRPFYETQRTVLPAVPRGAPTTNVSAGLNLTVQRTRAGGPVRVAVRDNATGEPVDVVVRLDDARVGQTGADGVLWTVADRGAISVTISDGARTVSVTQLGLGPAPDAG